MLENQPSGRKISVVIPVKNGATTIEKCLTSIYTQSIANCVEVVIIDSGSTDGTLEIISKYPVKLFQIPAETFNHGLTRNYGVSLSSGKYIFLTVQDAWLAETDHLERMSSHFSDKEVKAVVGMQATSHEKDKNPYAWFKRCTEPEIEIRHFKNQTFDLLTLNEQHKQSQWDDVNAMYRREALEKIKFAETNYMEDWLWANKALKNGYKLVFDPSLVVYHYHHRSFCYEFKLMYTINYHFFVFFHVSPSMPAWVIPNLKVIYHLVRNKNLTVLERLYWIGHNISSRTGNYLSHLVFKGIYFLFKQHGLKKSYNFICKQIPQGKQKIQEVKLSEN